MKSNELCGFPEIKERPEKPIKTNWENKRMCHYSVYINMNSCGCDFKCGPYCTLIFEQWLKCGYEVKVYKNVDKK